MTEPQSNRGMGFSFPLFVPLLLQPILLVAMVVFRARNWVFALHGIYMVLVAYFLWKALSRTQFERVHASRPSLTRGAWTAQWLFFFVILPLLLWVFFGLLPLLKFRT